MAAALEFHRALNGGIVSNALLPRQDVTKPANGVADMANFIAMRSGGAQNRPGTRYVADCVDQADTSRLERFFFNESQAYAIELGDKVMRLFQIGAVKYANNTLTDGNLTTPVSGNFYPDSDDDDLASLTGTLPSAVVSPGANFVESRLETQAAGGTTRLIQTASGSRTASEMYSTVSGHPGAAGLWVDAVHTLTINISRLSASLTTALLVPRLHRTNSGGVGQERGAFGGAANGDPNSVVLPDGTTGSLGATGVDIDAGGTGTYVFTWNATASTWAGPAADTDRLTLELVFSYSGASTLEIEYSIDSAKTFLSTPIHSVNHPGVLWDAAAGYTVGDVVFTGTASSPTDYFYCVADNTGKDPDDTDYQDDFWYLLSTDSAGDPILEIPTPWAAADLADLDFQQSADVITVTHPDYPPHEIIRSVDDIYTNGKWTCLPVAFKPRSPAPTAVFASDPGSSTDPSAKKLRYKVTFLAEVGGESAVGSHTLTRGNNVDPGSANLTDEATVKIASAESTTEDLVCNQASHTLEDGDEIHIETVATTDTDRAHQNAKELLEGATFVVSVIDSDNFSLDGTAGQLTLGPISNETEGYPEFAITYGLGYVEFDGFLMPKSAAARRIELTWTPGAGAGEGTYLIYRWIEGLEEWGLLGSTRDTTFADEGDTEIIANQNQKVIANVNTEDKPPEYRNPFRFDNWPRASSYHQNRQFFAGTNTEPLRLWGSTVGDFRNFSIRGQLTDEDTLDFRITAVGANEIQRITSLGNLLLIATTGGVVTAAGRLSPLEAPDLETLTYEGVAAKPTVVVDQSFLFVQARSSIMRDMQFDLGNGGLGGYRGKDLTVFAPDLFQGYTVSEMVRGAIPEPIVWAMRSDGTILGLTYVPEHDIWGWHRHVTRDGDVFQSITVVPEAGADVLYAIAKRSVNGSTVYHVERMDIRQTGYPSTDDRITAYFLDDGLTYNGTNTDGATTLTLTGGSTWAAGETGLTLTATGGTPFPGDTSNVGNGYRIVDADGNEAEVLVTTDGSTTVQTVTLLTAVPAGLQGAASTTAWVLMADDLSGLDHLEGEAVTLLADGNELGPFTVSSGAIATLSRPYGIIHAGLLIESSIELLDIDPGGNNPVVALRKRVVRLTGFLEEARGLTAAIPGGTFQSFDLEGGETAASQVTGKRVVRFAESWERRGRVALKQTHPFPAQVNAALLEYETGGVA